MALFGSWGAALVSHGLSCRSFSWAIVVLEWFGQTLDAQWPDVTTLGWWWSGGGTVDRWWWGRCCFFAFGGVVAGWVGDGVRVWECVAMRARMVGAVNGFSTSCWSPPYGETASC